MARPVLGWDDLRGHRVGIYGLGVEGHATLRACRVRGIDPVIVDDAPVGGKIGHDVPRVLGTSAGGLEALLGCDVVVKSPGISRYGAPVRALERAGIPVVGGLGLWLVGVDRSRVLLITGTKGKSTTAAIAGHLLRQWGYRVLVGGNIGTPPWDPQLGADAEDIDYYVIEVSSYQATDLPVTPPVTAVTTLAPDHLPWHDGDPERYYADKLSAVTQIGAQVTVVNGDSDVLHSHLHLLGPQLVWVYAEQARATAWIDRMGLIGDHNRRNALMAATALAQMGVEQAGDDAALAAAATDFQPLPSRLTLVARLGGIDFVDDGLSTNVLPVLAAVSAFADRTVALLVGGQSRGIDYRPLGAGLIRLRAQGPPLRVVTMPSNGPQIGAAVRAAIRAAGFAGARPVSGRSGRSRLRRSRLRRPRRGGRIPLDVVDTGSLAEAVAAAARWAGPDGVVLLSPAAPSFDHYRDYRARGEAFLAAAGALGAAAVRSVTRPAP